MYSANEGQNLICSTEFLDENGLTATLKMGYPKAKLMYNNMILADLSPIDMGTKWDVIVDIPELGFDEPTPIQLKWRAVDTDGVLHKTTDLILVQPLKQPDIGDIVVMHDETDISYAVPVHLTDSDIVSITIYLDNDAIANISIDASQRIKKSNHTLINLTKPDIVLPMLKSYLIVLEYDSGTKKQRLMNNLWVVTPQILNCMNAIEASLNKAKLDNVIPQLEYSQSDLLQYLQRGLNLFNGYSPNLTDFNGTNMQGALFDALILCGSYYALGAQLLAEGMMAFDFTGSAVTLNVDRTPALEGALGRVESTIQERIPKLKQLLLRRGVSGGSGSDAVGSSRGIGMTVLTNAPTTSKNIWRMGHNYNYR